MPKSLGSYLSQEELNQIAEAVKTTEEKTSGEIVPYVLPASDVYEEAYWRGSAFSMLFTLLLFLAIRYLSDYWFSISLFEALLMIFGGSAFGAILTFFFPRVRMLLAGKHLIEERVSAKAAQVFLSEDISSTRERTGILIFLSLIERRVVVLGDREISKTVGKQDWEEIVSQIVKSIKDETVTIGLIEGIRACGNLLAKAGIVRRSNDTNELPNDLRFPGADRTKQ